MLFASATVLAAWRKRPATSVWAISVIMNRA